MRAHRLFIATTFLFFLLAGLSFSSLWPAAAQTANGSASAALINEVGSIAKQLDALDAEIAQKSRQDNELIRMQGQLEKLMLRAGQLRNEFAPVIKNIKAQIKELGPAPAKDAPAEAEAVAAERKILSDRLGENDAADKKTAVLQARMEQILRQVQELRRAIFAAEIFRQNRSPLNPAFWRKVNEEAERGLSQMQGFLRYLKDDIGQQRSMIYVLVAALIGWLVLHILAKGATARIRMRYARHLGFESGQGGAISELGSGADSGAGPGTDPGMSQQGGQNALGPDYFTRAACAAWVTLVRIVPLMVAALGAYIGLNSVGILSVQVDQFVRVVLIALIIYAVVSALVQTMLAPKNAIWRLYPLSNTAAKTLYWLMLAIAVIYIFNMVWVQTNQIIYAPLSFTIGQNYVASVLFSLLLCAISFVHFDKPIITSAHVQGESVDPSAPSAAGEIALGGTVMGGPVMGQSLKHHELSRFWPLWLKGPLLVLAAVIFIAANMGYIAFAQFLSSQVIITGAIIILGLLLHIAIKAACADIQNEATPLGRNLATRFALEESQRKQIAIVLGFIANLVLVAAITPFILLEWGFSWSDIRVWLSSIFFGFQFGGLRLSLSTLLLACALFIIGLIATRFIQRWLDRGVLTLPHLRGGMANSIRTGIGYVGFLLSLLVAVSYAGMDFTNFAIVAGALSVGIGFGLQSIVNNFVSGLILLVERPVKVGDWVIVGEHQGHVRRISVRATEIETFDRSSVIIPNSELITGVVTNWTHGNSVGRVLINIGVAYASDAAKVYKILMDVAAAHPKTLTYPKHKVVFEDFGSSSLDFTLRVYISNINDTLEVQTELRMAILEVFRRENIEIPFPQQDIHVKDIKTLAQDEG